MTSVPGHNAVGSAAPPLFGVSVSVAKTRKLAPEGESPTELPKAVIVHPGDKAPPPVAATVNVHPAAMMPPETEHVNVAGVNRLAGPTELEIVTDVSAPLKPDPVMVTTSPILPWSSVSEIIGPPVFWNAVVAIGAPAWSWYCTAYVPDGGAEATVKVP